MSSRLPTNRAPSQRCWTTFDKRSSESDDMLEHLDIESCPSDDEIDGTKTSNQMEVPSLDTTLAPASSPQHSSWQRQRLSAGSKTSTPTTQKRQGDADIKYNPGVSSQHQFRDFPFRSALAPTVQPKGKASLHHITASKADSAQVSKNSPELQSSDGPGKRDHSLIFDDDGVHKIDSEDEDLQWGSKSLDWDGYFLPKSTPQETYPFEGTGSSTETLVTLANNIPGPLRRARHHIADAFGSARTMLMPQTIPLDMLKSAPDEIRRLVERAREEGRHVPERVREWALAARRAALDVVNVVPPLDVQVAASRGRVRR